MVPVPVRQHNHIDLRHVRPEPFGVALPDVLFRPGVEQDGALDVAARGRLHSQLTYP
jgi:hypothetical protein